MEVIKEEKKDDPNSPENILKRIANAIRTQEPDWPNTACEVFRLVSELESIPKKARPQVASFTSFLDDVTSLS